MIILGENVSFQVLNTAIGIVKGLAPLSLANEMNLSCTGIEGLSDMSEYLKEICLSNDGACVPSTYKLEITRIRSLYILCIKVVHRDVIILNSSMCYLDGGLIGECVALVFTEGF